MSLIVIGVSHHTAPVELRERFAFKESEIPDALGHVLANGSVQEAVLLSTCNRVELYAAAPDACGDDKALAAMFADLRGAALNDSASVYVHRQPQSAEHLFRVASGLDSMVLGETEILGQLKNAYRIALEQKRTGKQLNKLFQKAFNLAKRVRTETQIQRGNTSVASVAVDLAEKVFDTLKGRHVLVIGAGDTSEKTARALASRGTSSIFVSNRSFDRAQELAKALNGDAIHFDEWENACEQIDIAVSSTAAPHYVLDRARTRAIMKNRANRPLLLVDIAVPRDVDPEVNLLDNVYLYNIDDLQTIADSALRRRQDELALCEKLIRESALPWRTPLPSAPEGRLRTALIAAPAL